MSYIISYRPNVIKHDIPALGEEMKRRSKMSIEEKLTTRPEIFGAPLRESLKGLRKLRVGDYRIIFLISHEKVIIFGILHRSVVYEIMKKRITEK